MHGLIEKDGVAYRTVDWNEHRYSEVLREADDEIKKFGRVLNEQPDQTGPTSWENKAEYTRRKRGSLTVCSVCGKRIQKSRDVRSNLVCQDCSRGA